MLTAGARARKARAHQGLEPVHLAAGAGEDRAALSGHPRKANAGQYAGVMQQRNQAPCPATYFRCNSSFLVCPAVSARHTGAPRHSW